MATLAPEKTTFFLHEKSCLLLGSCHDKRKQQFHRVSWLLTIIFIKVLIFIQIVFNIVGHSFDCNRHRHSPFFLFSLCTSPMGETYALDLVI